MSSGPSDPSSRFDAYWKANIRIVLVLMVIWFVASFGLGILAVVPLNKIKLGGFPLGFWFAQQGAIYVFVGLVIAYALIMEKLDRKFDVHEVEEAEATPANAEAETQEAP